MVQLSLGTAVSLRSPGSVYDTGLVFQDGVLECPRVLLAALSPALREILKVGKEKRTMPP